MPRCAFRPVSVRRVEDLRGELRGSPDADRLSGTGRYLRGQRPDALVQLVFHTLLYEPDGGRSLASAGQSEDQVYNCSGVGHVTRAKSEFAEVPLHGQLDFVRMNKSLILMR